MSTPSPQQPTQPPPTDPHPAAQALTTAYQSELHAFQARLEARILSLDQTLASPAQPAKLPNYGIELCISSTICLAPSHPGKRVWTREGMSFRDARALLRWSAVHLEPLDAVSQPDGAVFGLCPICHEGLGGGVEGRRAVRIRGVEGCMGHVFCSGCIVEWLMTDAEGNRTCPMCRSELVGTRGSALWPGLWVRDGDVGVMSERSDSFDWGERGGYGPRVEGSGEDGSRYDMSGDGQMVRYRYRTAPDGKNKCPIGLVGLWVYLVLGLLGWVYVFSGYSINLVLAILAGCAVAMTGMNLVPAYHARRRGLE